METQEHSNTSSTEHIIETVYRMLQSREIHPSGTFDKAGRWYAEHSDLISVRNPSRNWKYSEMAACRTKKYVKKVCEKYGCRTIAELKSRV